MTGYLYDSVDYGLIMSFQETKIILNQQNYHDCPGKVNVVDWLKDELNSLIKLFNHAIPPKRIVQGQNMCTTEYGFGDVSGSGFGTSREDQGREKKYREKNWGNNMAGKSSNLRELKKTTETLEIISGEGRLSGVEFFIFTYNITAEAAYFNGTSSS